jgi:hypothetical protein
MRRAVYLLALLLVVPLGLASRAYGGRLPAPIALYAGDTLWALALYWLLRAIAPRRPAHHTALACVAIAWANELLQLWHPGWLERIRATTLGHLALGHGFVWSDLICYLAGAAIGLAADRAGGRVVSSPGRSPG